MLLDGIKDDAQCAVKGFAVVLEVVAQPLGQGQHPLAHRQAGQDMVGQMRGGLHHAPGVAGGADAAPFAGEGDEKVMAAVVAARPGEPVETVQRSLVQESHATASNLRLGLSGTSPIFPSPHSPSVVANPRSHGSRWAMSNVPDSNICIISA